jgi:hypothetical protein
LHLVAVLGALNRVGGKLPKSNAARKLLETLTSDPSYLWRAARQITPRKGSARTTAAAGSRLVVEDGGQVPALHAIICSLGLKNCFGKALYNSRLRKCLWSADTTASLLASHLEDVCRSFGGGFGRPKGSSHGLKPRQLQPSSPAWVQNKPADQRITSALALQQSRHQSDKNSKASGDDPAEVRGIQESDDAVGKVSAIMEKEELDSIYEQRILDKARFLSDLDFLNRCITLGGLDSCQVRLEDQNAAS